MTAGPFARVALPLGAGIVALILWEAAVHVFAFSPFVLPAPSAIWAAFLENMGVLLPALGNTALMTAMAFVCAFVLGMSLAIAFAQSPILERALYPYAVILQVTPIVSIAPFVVIWAGPDDPNRAVLILATIVAFFPILSNGYLGLKSADANLLDLFRLYGATRSQTLWRLLLPSAMPFILAGVKIGAGLALVGAVVAEMVAGSGAASGLAWRIVEASNRLQMAKMFAGLGLLAGFGILLFYGVSWLETRLLRRWHDSARI